MDNSPQDAPPIPAGAYRNVSYDAAIGLHLTSDVLEAPTLPTTVVGQAGEIRTRLADPLRKMQYLPSLFAILVGVSVIAYSLLGVLTFNARGITKVLGSSLSIFGVLLSTTELLIPIRARMQQLARDTRKRVRNSYIWELYYSDGLRACFYGVGVCLVFGPLALLDTEFRFTLVDWLEHHHKEYFLPWIVMSPILLGLCLGLIASMVERVLFWLVSALMFIPRTIFWGVMLAAENVCMRTQNVTSCRYAGGLLAIVGTVVLAIVN